MIATFLDFEKAFDKIWHVGLIHKVLQLQIPIPLVKIISSYLTNRLYSVHENGCLLLLLFAISMNDLPTILGVYINVFAEDTMLFASSVGTQHATNKIQNQINIILI